VGVAGSVGNYVISCDGGLYPRHSCQILSQSPIKLRNLCQRAISIFSIWVGFRSGALPVKLWVRMWDS
jgi:hypothetical protein